MKGLRGSGAQSATTLLDELIAGLGLAPLESDADRLDLEAFVEFVKEWEQKSEEKQLRDFIEYLGYFDEAGGDICLDEEPSDDAVQLMTVHSAKGWNFRTCSSCGWPRANFRRGRKARCSNFRRS